MVGRTHSPATRSPSSPIEANSALSAFITTPQRMAAGPGLMTWSRAYFPTRSFQSGWLLGSSFASAPATVASMMLAYATLSARWVTSCRSAPHVLAPTSSARVRPTRVLASSSCAALSKRSSIPDLIPSSTSRTRSACASTENGATGAFACPLASWTGTWAFTSQLGTASSRLAIASPSSLLVSCRRSRRRRRPMASSSSPSRSRFRS